MSLPTPVTLPAYGLLSTEVEGFESLEDRAEGMRR